MSNDLDTYLYSRLWETHSVHRVFRTFWNNYSSRIRVKVGRKHTVAWINVANIGKGVSFDAIFVINIG